jgi:hypothetical protein
VLAEEGAAAGWATKPNQWSLTDVVQVADDRAEATSRLDSLMKTSALVRPRRSAWRWAAAALLACAVVGGAAAALTRPVPLLAGAQHGPAAFPDSVWQQLLHAKRVNTEDAWLAALNHSQADYYHQRLAKEGLAYYYLTRRQEFDKAIKPLQELADLGDSQPAFRAFGIAGLVVAYANLGQIELADQENSRLTSEMRALLRQHAPLMADLLDEMTEQ